MEDLGLLSYSNSKNINVIPKAAFEKAFSETFETISENISKSLGPLGSSAMILDGALTSATKDGYTILNNYRFTNRYKRMFFNLIQKPCYRLNCAVGDGTTTSIVLTNYLFQIYKNKKEELETLFRLPKTFLSVWDSAVDEIIGKLSGYAKPVSNDEIYHIAYISSNGNEEVSKTIAGIYNECSSPVIREKDSPTNKTYIEAIKGYELPANLVSDAYVRNEDLSVEESNLALLIFDYKVETDLFMKVIAPLNDVLRSLDRKLLVIAPAFDRYLVDTRLKEYQNFEFQRYRAFNLLIAQCDSSQIKDYQVEDLAVLARTFIIDQTLGKSLLSDFDEESRDSFVRSCQEDKNFKYYGLIGSVAKAQLSCVSGSTFEPIDVENNEKYQEVLKSVYKQLHDRKAVAVDEAKSINLEIYKLQSRINRLEMKNYIYYIGANSDLQKKILWAQVEDVIKCVSSAVQNGSLPGCQLSIIRAATEISDSILASKDNDPLKLSSEEVLKCTILKMIIDSVICTYTTVLEGPEKTGILKLIPDWFVPKSDPELAKLEGEDKEKRVNELREEKLKELKILITNKRNEIISESIKQNCVFDLETLEYNPKIITSAETDKLVLLAASELVKTLISGTQCIYLDAEVNNSEVTDLGKM